MAVAIHVEFELSSSSACLTAYTGIVLSALPVRLPMFRTSGIIGRIGGAVASIADSQRSW
jgi:hypothetical protein